MFLYVTIVNIRVVTNTPMNEHDLSREYRVAITIIRLEQIYQCILLTCFIFKLLQFSQTVVRNNN